MSACKELLDTKWHSFPLFVRWPACVSVVKVPAICRLRRSLAILKIPRCLLWAPCVHETSDGLIPDTQTTSTHLLRTCGATEADSCDVTQPHCIRINVTLSCPQFQSNWLEHFVVPSDAINKMRIFLFPLQHIEHHISGKSCFLWWSHF